jgi:glucose/arabinose dehydrogenase
MTKNIVISAAVLAAFSLTAPLSGQTQTPTQPQTQAPTQTPATTVPPTQMPATVTPVQTSQPQPVGTTGTTSISDTEHGTAILLLERVQKVLDEAADGKSKDGTVTIDRGVLDELRAELSQARSSLKTDKR